MTGSAETVRFLLPSDFHVQKGEFRIRVRCTVKIISLSGKPNRKESVLLCFPLSLSGFMNSISIKNFAVIKR